MVRPPKVRYCTRCVYPSSSAVPLVFDEHGVCSGCKAWDQVKTIDWVKRREMLEKIISQYRGKKPGNYDCVIGVGGGKDSYFQVYLAIEELKLKPLMVTYHGNNFMEVGEKNLERMRHVFDTDHLIFRPSEKLLQKLNKKCFYIMGDMNWHNHCGIYTYPIQVAYKLKIPLILWAEHGYIDLGGMYSMNDMVEMTSKFRKEHALRGYDWYDMIDSEMGIKENDLLWAKYPTDEELEEVGIRGIYLGNFIPWDAYANTQLIMKRYGWQAYEGEFDRTYRKISNLDDMHENGVHDYLKYIKFGYGRASDHASKDIRRGYMTREKGIEMVRKYDHIKPGDLKRWLEYVDMTKEDFDKVCDSFRDPRVWWRNEKDEWVKDNIWDE